MAWRLSLTTLLPAVGAIVGIAFTSCEFFDVCRVPVNDLMRQEAREVRDMVDPPTPQRFRTTFWSDYNAGDQAQQKSDWGTACQNYKLASAVIDRMAEYTPKAGEDTHDFDVHILGGCKCAIADRMGEIQGHLAEETVTPAVRQTCKRNKDSEDSMESDCASRLCLIDKPKEEKS